MALPTINIGINNTIQAGPEDGSLVYRYAPLKNLKGDDGDLIDFSVIAKDIKVDVNTPLQIDVEKSYDNSTNLILNDKNNPLKLINTRFYLKDSLNYKIADREGALDTNIYSKDNILSETSLIKRAKTISSLDFLGIEDGGILHVGLYTFYFKLADADGNESDFIAESGPVTCYVGSVDDPSSIRGGQYNEDSGKIVKFLLKNIDLSFSYINIYYTKSTGSNDVATLETFKIEDKFKIGSLDTSITITGYETHTKIGNEEINLQYAAFDAAKTSENCQKMTFIGGSQRNYDLYETLEKYSLSVVPEICLEEKISLLDEDFEKKSVLHKPEYYSAENTYYRLGHWDEEIYRFGIVYIMNDYTLSPEFNVRGVTVLDDDFIFTTIDVDDVIKYGEDGVYLSNSENIYNPENTKGVFKIDLKEGIFSANTATPIGLKFRFKGDVIEGNSIKDLPGLKDITKGCFIVRQKRIPTILTQGLSIGTEKTTRTPVIYGSHYDSETNDSLSYFMESFLKKESDRPKLGRSFFTASNVLSDSLICPEATLDPEKFGSIFNSSNFILKKIKNDTNALFLDKTTNNKRNKFFLGSLGIGTPSTNLDASLLLVTPGISQIGDTDHKFKSLAGDAGRAWEALDIKGDLEEASDNYKESEWTKSTTKIRGIFNTYIGTSYKYLEKHQLYNIYQKDYNFTKRWRDYFKVRYNNKASFFAVSDRISWENTQDRPIKVYRGDCFINTVAHRMNWNFIDPELPTTNKIIDNWTWHKNYRVAKENIEFTGNNIGFGDGWSGESTIFYQKLLELFTYSSSKLSDAKVIPVDGKDFEKKSEENGLYGVSKINRPDVNAVPLGHWIVFPVCSNINIALRDLDFSRSSEEALFGLKRSFHPLQEADPNNKLPESSIYNKGYKEINSKKSYFELPDVPFLKNTFNTRIHYSQPLQESSFKNGNRIFIDNHYRDYSNEYGAIVKLVERFGTLIAVMEKGILMIPVNERALMANASGENVYVNTENVLPKNPKVISDSFGSMWESSIVKTNRFIYGIDTVGKKIWRTNGEVFDIISNLKIQKFLNDNITLNRLQNTYMNGSFFIKTHFNANKEDVMFTFVTPDNQWHICWNELLEKWVTRYSWFPEYSENINNIFYTFANETHHIGKGNILYKHGFAGLQEEAGNILPTKWYDMQYPFEFEFVVIGVQGTQKIFDNLKIISNLTEPDSFYYEIAGEGFNWVDAKDSIYSFTTQDEFENYLLGDSSIKKVPYIFKKDNFTRSWVEGDDIRDVTLLYNDKTKQKEVLSYQKGMDIKKKGRLKGNMNYVEDAWDVQIQPIIFKYAYLDSSNTLLLSDNVGMKIRDKYIKIRIRYDGTRYALINSLLTLFTVSYA